MRILNCTVAVALISGVALAADNPDWAYPATPPPGQIDNVTMLKVPGSTKQYTQAQIDDAFNPPDWFPDEHPPMPKAVATGGPKPAGRACGLCHLPSGDGHPESSNVAGLNANYMIRQMAAFKAGERTGVRATTMIALAKVFSDDEIKAAVDYFTALKPSTGYTKVMETQAVAKSYVGAGGMRFATPNGGTEPIGQRIIVLPMDEEQAKLRNPKSGFISYVPPGSLAKGAALMAGGDGKTVACTICHGETLKGLGEVPGIAGRDPIYTFRQLNDMKTGNRKGPWVELMKQVVVKLSDEDMISLAAFLGSLDP